MGEKSFSLKCVDQHFSERFHLKKIRFRHALKRNHIMKFYRPMKATQCWEPLSINFKGLLPCNYDLLTVVHVFSYFSFTLTCKDMTLGNSSQCLLQLLAIFGKLLYVHIGWSSFMSCELCNFLVSHRVTISQLTPCNLQGSGQFERSDSMIWKTAATCSYLSIHWAVFSPDALHAIHSLLHVATNSTHKSFPSCFPELQLYSCIIMSISIRMTLCGVRRGKSSVYSSIQMGDNLLSLSGNWSLPETYRNVLSYLKENCSPISTVCMYTLPNLDIEFTLPMSSNLQTNAFIHQAICCSELGSLNLTFLLIRLQLLLLLSVMSKYSVNSNFSSIRQRNNLLSLVSGPCWRPALTYSLIPEGKVINSIL